MTDDHHTALSRLPQLDALLRRDDVVDLVSEHGRPVVVATLRAVLDEARTRILADDPAPDDDELVADARRGLTRRARQRLTRVINATGVVLHTNLGRAPLSKAARDAMSDAAGYTTLELDLDTGRRGSRTATLGRLVAEACGTPAATVVNNGAAATVLVLAALAAGRRTIVSRGELVEIGGSFRLPDIMAISGSSLVEVGTTNRTRLADYAAAIDEETALLLKVHRSNFTIVGFTAEVAIDELVGLGRDHDVSVVHDLGSGLLREVDEGPLRDEPSVEASVRAGADLVIFSGDKLLGGPQAGIIAGDAELVRACASHPLARAMRIDKFRRAALEATLDSHLHADPPVDVPTVAMLHSDPAALASRARRIAAELGAAADAREVASVVGGGALPAAELDSWAVSIEHPQPDALAARLRDGDVPVICRVDDQVVLLDVRTVAPSQDDELIGLVRRALGA